MQVGSLAGNIWLVYLSRRKRKFVCFDYAFNINMAYAQFFVVWELLLLLVLCITSTRISLDGGYVSDK